MEFVIFVNEVCMYLSGGSGWVYTRPQYTFQEELVLLLLLHTTPYIYSLILLASVAVKT